ncbi:hypothetical protein A3G69_05695 [Candidatus Peribacteria bacterium RIFCSPLOWO2_12_FULL_53_10]|nr:MAG: hypothetical protein A3G69_05695 [Candidatus Peribacteria bacterium RIFCSPLOWO2_12_FULL_53_10]
MTDDSDANDFLLSDLPYEKVGEPNRLCGLFAAAVQRMLKKIEDQGHEPYPISFRFLRTQFLFLFNTTATDMFPPSDQIRELIPELTEIGHKLELGDGDPRNQSDNTIDKTILGELGEFLDRYEAALLD